MVDIFFAHELISEDELIATYCPRFDSYVQQKALNEFSSFDLNGDYSIDVLEITAWLRIANQTYDFDTVYNQFQELDTNDDYALNLTEFCDAYGDAEPEPEPEPYSESDYLVERYCSDIESLTTAENVLYFLD